MATKINKGFTPPLVNPTPAQIKDARLAIGLTQTVASDLVHAKLRTWQQWEAGDREMHLGFWELFQIKAARITHKT